MLKFIDSNDNSILDLGAGQMYIKSFLPKSVTYYPIDYMKRFPETIVYDLNEEVPNIKADVAFCSGIIELSKMLKCYSKN